MSPEIVEGAAKWIAIGASLVTVASNAGRLTLEWLKQRHEVQSARTKQSRDITNQYLDRALDPNAPLAIRHQLLRFLATPDVNGMRLSTWAESELKRIGSIVDETNRAVVAAEEERQRAKTAAELAEADKKLADAVRKQSSLLVLLRYVMQVPHLQALFGWRFLYIPVSFPVVSSGNTGQILQEPEHVTE